MVNQLLTELDGVEELEKVVIIAATNRPDLIDSALTRPGRIDAIVELKIPDKLTREKIFAVHTKNMPLDKAINLDNYVKKTENWTGADIEAVCRNAGMNAIKRVYKEKVKEREKQEVRVTKEDFDKALEEVSKSINKSIFEEKKENTNKKEDKVKN